MTGFRKRTKEITQNKGHRETKASNIFKGKTKEEFGGIFFYVDNQSLRKREKKKAMSKNVPDSEESGRYQKG